MKKKGTDKYIVVVEQHTCEMRDMVGRQGKCQGLEGEGHVSENDHMNIELPTKTSKAQEEGNKPHEIAVDSFMVMRKRQNSPLRGGSKFPRATRSL